MKTDRLWMVGLALYLLFFLGLVVYPWTASSQDTISAASPTTLLTRTMIREAGVRAYERDDGPAIHAVISFRAEHIYRTDYVSALLRATNRAPFRLDAPRPWIVGIWPRLEQPEHWPGHLSWDRNRPHVRRTFQHSRDTLRGDIVHQCRMPGAIDDVYAVPHDWGSEHDAVTFREEHPEAIELDCGQTCSLDRRTGEPRLTRDGLPRCNHFFHFPHYGARFDEG